MRPCRLLMLLLALAVLAVGGCGYRISPEVRQQMLDNQATTIEWAEALQLGAPPEAAAAGIRAMMDANMHCMGLEEPYVPTTERGDE